MSEPIRRHVGDAANSASWFYRYRLGDKRR